VAIHCPLSHLITKMVFHGIPWNKGKKMAEKTRLKLVAAAYKRWSDPAARIQQSITMKRVRKLNKHDRRKN
jgi:hypothetical protein